MTEVYGTLVLGSEDRNAESLGVFVAWLVCNNLLSEVLERSYGRAVARVRMHDMTGPEFLTTILHGELRADHLNDAGRGFTEHFLVAGHFEKLYEDCAFEGDDEWSRFAAISPGITAAFRRWREPAVKKKTARIIKFPGRR